MGPVALARICAVGCRIGRAARFYFGAAAGGVVQLGLLRMLARTPAPADEVK